MFLVVEPCNLVKEINVLDEFLAVVKQCKATVKLNIIFYNIVFQSKHKLYVACVSPTLTPTKNSGCTPPSGRVVGVQLPKLDIAAIIILQGLHLKTY
jgi:hypothetical protein